MWLQELIGLLGEEKVLVKESVKERLSKDYYWYSPILYEQLKDKVADCAVIPESIEELKTVVSFAVKNHVPITARGAGTGNYGQAIPLKGGIILDLTNLDEIIEIREKHVHVQAGVRLGMLERTLRQQGRELRIYPSTYMKSTVGGFLCGGSGGIGSIRWGNLWDSNILGVTILTIEENPQILTIEGEEIEQYIHNYGTTGIVIEAVLPIETRTEWSQHIVFFDSFKEAVRFSDELAHNETMIKRLLSVCEWPIPSHFQPLKDIIHEGKSIVMLEIEEQSEEKLQLIVQKYGGDIGYSIPADSYQKGLKISDFTWNHATLWAHKHGENMTYLQARFKTEKIFEQMDAIREKFGSEVQFHFEYIKIKGEITPASLPVILYQSKERLYEIIDFFRSAGVEINDPHTYLLGFGGYNLRIGKILKKKKENDPHDLLNPGKIPSPEEVEDMEHSKLELSNIKATPVKTNKKYQKVTPILISPIITFLLFMFLWQFGTQMFQIPPYLLPKPTDIVQAVIASWDNLRNAVTRTITESVVGFLLSVIGGIIGAILMASSKLLERSLYPYAILLQTIPIVAIAPIIVIWFGSGLNAIVIIAFTIGFFPMLSNTLIGLNATDRGMINLLKLYQASNWQIMWKVRIPAALPYIMAGLKISCTLAVVGAIVGEYIAGIGGGNGGLGYAITVASTRMETAYLFACGISASILGIVFFLVVNLFSKMILGSWHESEMKKEA